MRVLEEEILGDGMGGLVSMGVGGLPYCDERDRTSVMASGFIERLHLICRSQ